MLIVFLVIGILLVVVGCLIEIRGGASDAAVCASVVMGLIATLGSIIIMCVSAVELVNGRYIDEKIAMYQDENTKIECRVADAVDAYLEHETEILQMATVEATPETAITVVAAYPELNSSELIAKQIEVYTENNQKIKELQEDKINLRASRWWFYFG